MCVFAGITLSKEQVRRGTELAAEQGVGNARFQVMDALAMTWPDDSFDLVWACESGEHMPDKKRYVEEMTRVLKPGRVRSANARKCQMLLHGCRNGSTTAQSNGCSRGSVVATHVSLVALM